MECKEAQCDNPIKVYVAVTARFDEDGQLYPLSVRWEDEREYAVDRVLDVRPAASLRAGGAGIRYTIRVQGTRTYLYREGERWFVERREPHSPG